MTYGEILEKFCEHFIMAGTAGAIAKTLVAPLDRLKVILQNQDSTFQVMTGQRQRYSGLYDLLRRWPKEQGYWSFWRGNGVNVGRYATMQAFNFSLNDSYKAQLGEVIENDKAVKFLAGGMAGASALAITYPLDFCQTRLVADVGTDGKSAKVKREFDNFSHCMRTVYKVDGIRGYYRGLLVAVLGIAIYRSMYFSFFEISKQHLLTSEYYKGAEKLPVYIAFVLAQVVTTMSGFLSYPFDTVLRRVMLDSARPTNLRKYRNAVDALKTIYKNGGIRGFYHGMVSNVFRSTGGAMVLVFYDEFEEIQERSGRFEDYI